MSKFRDPFSLSLQSTDVMVQRSLLLVVQRCCCADCTYLVFSSVMANRTLFQMCGRLYLPMFLLRVGLLTLMYMVSLMALDIVWPALAMILKFSNVVLWPVNLSCSKIGDVAFKCSLYLSSKVLADSPIYSSSHSVLHPWNLYMMLLCFVLASLFFGNINRLFKVFPPLKCTWTPYLLQMFL